MRTQRTKVFIAGGGSVGMSLAAELSYRGVDCLIAEKSKEVNPHPRANAIASRTMEYYRRWGIDQDLVNSGISPNLPADYFFVSSLSGRVVYKIALPSHNTLMELVSSGKEIDPRLNYSPYLKTILGQNEVDKILKDHVYTRENIEKKFGWEVVGMTQNNQEVTALIKNTDSGEVEEVVADYLVACDGGRSLVRSTLGIKLEGEAGLGSFLAIHFKAPGLNRVFGHGNIYFLLRKESAGFVMNWDGGTTYTYHYILHEGEKWEDIQPEKLIKTIAGWDIPVEIYSCQPWTAHALVAKQYRCGRMFLAGDAAHLFTPTGGFGMNTGVSDIMDIAWKLQALLEGWGGDILLDTYFEERRPIGVRNTQISGNYFKVLKNIYRFGEVLDENTPAGEDARLQIHADLDAQVVGLIDSAGCLLGYRYEGSAICVPDGSEAPPDHPRLYYPTSRPGHRAPHVWIDKQRSVLDLFGKGFTLLRFDPSIDCGAMEAAARACGMPLALVDIQHPEAARVYEKKLVLVRPDLMVAWRSDNMPDHPSAILDRVRGLSTRIDVPAAVKDKQGSNQQPHTTANETG